jgi:hypothetical protein
MPQTKIGDKAGADPGITRLYLTDYFTSILYASLYSLINKNKRCVPVKNRVIYY